MPKHLFLESQRIWGENLYFYLIPQEISIIQQVWETLSWDDSQVPRPTGSSWWGSTALNRILSTLCAHEGSWGCGRGKCSQQAKPGESEWWPENALRVRMQWYSPATVLTSPALSSWMWFKCWTSDHCVSPPFHPVEMVAFVTVMLFPASSEREVCVLEVVGGCSNHIANEGKTIRSHGKTRPRGTDTSGILDLDVLANSPPN